MASSAQDFEITSVESLPNDFAAREEMKTDHNDRQCALLRVATQNIASEQREGFTFKTDLGSEIVERANRNGEIWLWVSPGLKYLRIMHRDMGQFELHLLDHVARVEALHTYKVVLLGTQSFVVKERGENIPTQQYLMFQITPANAMLEVDGQLWSVDADGTAMKYVNFGTYSYRVMASDYFTETGNVIVDDPENTKIVPVTLKPNFAEITLTVDADAEIWVNNVKKGTRTWTGSLGDGTYKIECKQANHETSMVSKEITPTMNGQTITLPAPTPIYGSLNVESTPNLATIYIDGKEVGKTPKSIPQIIIGQHEVKLTLDGYVDHVETITITKDEKKAMKVMLSNINYDKISKQGDDYYDAKNYEEALRCYREAAEHGNARGQDGIGELYYYGYAVQQDHAEAVKWYRLAAAQGLDKAQRHLGYMYELGIGVDKDHSEAVKWYRKAAEQGDDGGQNNLGFCYLHGIGVDKDYSEAVKWFRLAAEQGDATGQNNLGYMYFKGYGVNQDYSEAMRWFQKAANQGLPLAQYNIGKMYYNGEAIEEDFFEAEKWYRMAAEQGYAGAQNDLGWMYANGLGVAEDEAEAVKWYRKAAEQGYARAQCNLGNMYDDGKGVPQSHEEAVKWYREAAEQGLANAQYNLGLCYQEGIGVKQNLEEALKWYQKAAEQGVSDGYYQLGRYYLSQQNTQEGLKWLQLSAEQKNPDAAYELSGIYREGLFGLKANQNKADEWYEKAREYGWY